MKLTLMNKNHFFIATTLATIFSGCLYSNEDSKGGSSATALRSPGSISSETTPCPDPVLPSTHKPEHKLDLTQSGKVTLCHIPPGNPANAHTLSVGAEAVQAHFDHGDTIGSCIDPVPVDCGNNDDSVGSDDITGANDSLSEEPFNGLD